MKKQIDLRGILNILFIVLLIGAIYVIFIKNRNENSLTREIEQTLIIKEQTLKKVDSLQNIINKAKKEIEKKSNIIDNKNAIVGHLEAKLATFKSQVGSTPTQDNLSLILENSPPPEDSNKYTITGSNVVDHIRYSMMEKIAYKEAYLDCDVYNDELILLISDKNGLISALEEQNTVLKADNKSYNRQLKVLLKKLKRRAKRNKWLIAGGVVVVGGLIISK
jgi:hypothetical protein